MLAAALAQARRQQQQWRHRRQAAASNVQRRLSLLVGPCLMRAGRQPTVGCCWCAGRISAPEAPVFSAAAAYRCPGGRWRCICISVCEAGAVMSLCELRVVAAAHGGVCVLVLCVGDVSRVVAEGMQALSARDRWQRARKKSPPLASVGTMSHAHSRITTRKRSFASQSTRKRCLNSL